MPNDLIDRPRKFKALTIGFVCGALATAGASWALFGATMGTPTATFYHVGEKRLDYFGKGSSANCWGGHTIDGRCISAVYSNEGRWLPAAPPRSSLTPLGE